MTKTGRFRNFDSEGDLAAAHRSDSVVVKGSSGDRFYYRDREVHRYADLMPKD